MARTEPLLAALSIAILGCRQGEPPPAPPEPKFEADHAAGLAASPPGVTCRLRVDAEPAKRFAVEGETIPLSLEFSSATPGVHALDVSTYDRSGRMWQETFRVDPAGDAVDPLTDYFGGMTSGFGGLAPPPPKLDAKPVAVPLTLNEHIRFKRPGHYRLFVTSTRTSPPCTSNVVELRLVSDPEWAAKELVRIRAALAGKGDEDAAKRALHALRFLGTVEAASTLVDQLCTAGEGYRFDTECGIFGSPHRAHVVDLLREGLAAPECAVSPDYFRTLKKLDPSPPLGPLIAGLPAKSPRARAASLRTALQALADTPRDAPPDPRLPELRAGLATVFGGLPEESLARVLSDDWVEVRTPALAPVLLSLATEARPRGSRLRSLSDLALERLVELDPAAGRRLILDELARPGGARTSFSGPTLGLLPDAELPQLDAALLAGMRAETSDGATLELRAAVTARYASKAVVRDVWALYRASEYFRVSLLSYLMRHDPAGAEAEILRKGDLDTVHRLAPFGWNPALERVAVGQLSTASAGYAAQTLQEHGGPTAEAALVARLRALHDAGSDPDHLGGTLIQAIGRAKGWVTPPERLRAIALICDEEGKRAIGFLTDRWGRDGNHADLVLWSRGAPDNVTGWIAQYDVRSLADLRAKVEQMPEGTVLVWGTKPEDVHEAVLDQVRAWGKPRRIEVVPRPPAAPAAPAR